MSLLQVDAWAHGGSGSAGFDSTFDKEVEICQVFIKLPLLFRIAVSHVHLVCCSYVSCSSQCVLSVLVAMFSRV